MNIVVHYPTTDEGRKELQDRVDRAMANGIIYHIRKLKWETEKKRKLFNSVLEEFEEVNQ